MNSRFLTAVSVAALGLAVSACGKSEPANTAAADNAAMMTSNEVVMSDEMGGNMAGDPAVTTALSSKDFADTAAKSDAFEIAAAKLAEAHGSAKDVKDFAATMIKAHTESTAKIKAASAEASPAITPDATLKADQQAKLDALGKLDGEAFDKAYAAGQVTAHEEALAAMHSYAATGETPSLKAAASTIAPDVESHLAMAKKLPM